LVRSFCLGCRNFRESFAGYYLGRCTSKHIDKHTPYHDCAGFLPGYWYKANRPHEAIQRYEENIAKLQRMIEAVKSHFSLTQVLGEDIKNV